VARGAQLADGIVARHSAWQPRKLLSTAAVDRATIRPSTTPDPRPYRRRIAGCKFGNYSASVDRSGRCSSLRHCRRRDGRRLPRLPPGRPAAPRRSEYYPRLLPRHRRRQSSSGLHDSARSRRSWLCCRCPTGQSFRHGSRGSRLLPNCRRHSGGQPDFLPEAAACRVKLSNRASRLTTRCGGSRGCRRVETTIGKTVT